MSEWAEVRVDCLYTYEYGLVAFIPGECVRIVARAIHGPEARTIITDVNGFTVRLDFGEDEFLTALDGPTEPWRAADEPATVG